MKTYSNNGYSLSRNWFNFSFENPDKIKPIHTALYFFAIEHCNRLGWKEKFGFPTTMAMEAIGIKSYNTYINALNDIVDFGFIKMLEKSKNQYSSNIIALSNFNKALDKALDKALSKHGTKHCRSTVQSTDSIYKQTNNITNKQYNINNIDEEIETLDALKNHLKLSDAKFKNYLTEFKIPFLTQTYNEIEYRDKITHFINFVKKKEKPEVEESGKNGMKLNQAPKPLGS